MRYFDIKGNVEIDDSALTEEMKESLENNLIDFILQSIVDKFDCSFGGGIKEVDSEGNDIINNQKTK